MHRNKSVNVHQFAMIPRADIPRSKFRMQSGHKTSFDSSFLVPIYVDEVLPGDTFSMNATVFARLATPIFPFMDNVYLDTFWFFVPNRLVWNNWQKFQGEQEDPGDSIDYTVPQLVATGGEGGQLIESMTLFDYFGIPVTPDGWLAGREIRINALVPRAYNLIYNEWFRDQNLQPSVFVEKGDGPDTWSNYNLLRRGKRPDYFTGCLPWPQKGEAVSMPIGTSANVIPSVTGLPSFNVAGAGGNPFNLGATNNTGDEGHVGLTKAGVFFSDPGTDGVMTWQDTGLVADLSTATAATINQLRQAFQIQRLLERDARGGTRYVEILYQHFGVRSPDARLQRPEYLGGSSSAISINPVQQTSATDASTPQGNLAAFGAGVHRSGFSQSFVEHGHIICLANVRADLSYQQGLRKMWSRQTRYDFYMPVFAMLGEQAVLSREIYCDGNIDPGDLPNDDSVFGYQERWAEYRYHPSQITALMRSNTSDPVTYPTIDVWHLSQVFANRPVLDTDFIVENVPMDRVLAVGDEAGGQQFIVDCFFDCVAARPMPLYSVPGLIDHF